MCLATMTYVYTAAQYVTIFSTGGKLRPVSNFTELHALTQAAHSYVLFTLIYSLFPETFLDTNFYPLSRPSLTPICWGEGRG